MAKLFTSKEVKMAKLKQTETSRRDFIKLASVGTIVGGAGLATGITSQSANAAETKGKGYQNSLHVETYYDSARF